MKKIFCIFLTALSILFVSCYGSWNIFYDGNNVDSRTHSLKNITTAESAEFAASGVAALSGSYNVLVISDSHFGYKMKDAPLQNLYNWLNSVYGTPEAPRFAISLGDSTDTGSQEDYNEYLALCNKLKNDYGINIVFNAAGNHDIYQSHWDNWQANCYPHTSFYKFETSGFSWYSLDTASGTLGRQQYEIFIQAIEADPKPKVVYSHYPLTEYHLAFGLGETTERNLLIDKFIRNNVKCYLGGHNHYSVYHNNGFNEYCCPSLRFNGSWTVLHINETAGTASADFSN